MADAVRITRFPGAGIAVGGICISENVAMRLNIPVAGIRLCVGDSEVWLTRDEASDIAHALVDCLCDG
jgi:hypothetical protein